MSAPPVELYLVRHTRPAIHKDYFYGHLDVDVSQNFEAEAKSILSYLPGEIDRFYSSPLMRCQKLAEFMRKRKYPSDHYQLDDRLKEMYFGDWEGKRYQEILPEEFKAWEKDIYGFRIPGGESYRDLEKRVLSFIEDIRSLSGKRILVVTHAGVIRTLVAWIMDLPRANVFRIGVDYGSLSCLNIDREMALCRLRLLNSTGNK